MRHAGSGRTSDVPSMWLVPCAVHGHANNGNSAGPSRCCAHTVCRWSTSEAERKRTSHVSGSPPAVVGPVNSLVQHAAVKNVDLVVEVLAGLSPRDGGKPAEPSHRGNRVVRDHQPLGDRVERTKPGHHPRNVLNDNAIRGGERGKRCDTCVAAQGRWWQACQGQGMRRAPLKWSPHKIEPWKTKGRIIHRARA